MSDQASSEESSAPLSLSRLTAAFAKMLGGSGEKPKEALAPVEVATPEAIVEAMLFVGRQDDAPLTAEEIAEPIRDVSAAEVEQIVDGLNASYASDAAARRIERSAAGLRMVLDPDFDRLGERLMGRVKPARLSDAAMEVLSIVAYRQPVSSQQVEDERGKRSGAALAQLVRRGLLRLDGPAEPSNPPQYSTTERFLRLFELTGLGQLPKATELDD